jgi:hypothetical protein
MINARFQFIAGAILALTLLSACTSETLSNSFELKKQAATTIAKGLGLKTVWNSVFPFDVGRVYERVVYPDGTFGLLPYSQAFLGVITQTTNGGPITKTDPVNQTWQQNITGKGSVDLQLQYMGLELDTSVKNTRSVTFSASGDNNIYVADQPGFLNYLNTEPGGAAVKDAVMHDSQSRNSTSHSGTPSTPSKYWIVIDSLSVKNLTVTLNASTAASVQLSDAQAAAIATFAGIPVSGSISAGTSTDGSASITSPTSTPLVGVCVPLVWDARNKALNINPQKTLVYANGAAHDVNRLALQKQALLNHAQ